ncbi:hypothetical protein [Bradyrhizobium yuanmingense]|uniref:hypothetical protein n=1 Tax=Bradyrhizobium yuanmingense TaxID=108015 RepID=UPI0023B8D94E|nr:hypothetical protein [Bradyrhizobium yuanmingense]MDF0497323.1 hypothetical protein [Bradyrhizobium yuanmingense]
MTSREKLGGFLQDRRWMANVLDLTFQQSNRLADWGYPDRWMTAASRSAPRCKGGMHALDAELFP